MTLLKSVDASSSAAWSVEETHISSLWVNRRLIFAVRLLVMVVYGCVTIVAHRWLVGLRGKVNLAFTM